MTFNKRFLAMLITLIWLVGAVIALWYFFYMPLRPFAKHDALSGVDSVRLLGAKADRMTVLHFIDESCPCTKYGLAHISDLITKYSGQRHLKVNPDVGVKDSNFVLLNPLSIKSADGVSLAFSRNINEWVLSSPSVAVFDAGGDILYYGPYTAGAVCGEGFDFVSPLLDSNKAGLSLDLGVKAWPNLASFGCFCDW